MLTNSSPVGAQGKASKAEAQVAGDLSNVARLRRMIDLSGADTGEFAFGLFAASIDHASTARQKASLLAAQSYAEVALWQKVVMFAGIINAAVLALAEIYTTGDSSLAVSNITTVLTLLYGITAPFRTLNLGLQRVWELGSSSWRIDSSILELPSQRRFLRTKAVLENIAGKSGDDADAVTGKGGPLPPLTDELTLKDLTFSYSGSSQPVLKGLNATVKCGQYVCVVGSSGSGKSTMLSILTREQVEDSGNVCFDSRPLGGRILLLSSRACMRPCHRCLWSLGQVVGRSH